MSDDFELPKKFETNRKLVVQDEPKEKETKQDPLDGEEKEEKPKYDKEELNRIFDEILFSQEYQETVTIKGKMKVTFRTRSAEEIEAITKKLDATPANLVATLSEKRAILTLHDALVNYHGKDLSGMKLEDKARFVNKLPGVVVGALMRALQKFDDKCFEACKEGEENF